MVPHVLDAAGEHDVTCAVGDLTRAGGHSRQRARTHTVDRKAGNGLRNAGQQCDVATQRQPLVADLSGGRVDDVANALRRDLRIPPQ